MQKRLFLFGFLLLSFSLSEAEVNAGSGLVLLRKIQEKIPKEPPLYEEIKDSSKLATIRGYLDNERARTAISLYRSALEFSGAKQGGLSPDSPYYIAIQEGGNHASSGFRLLSGGKIRMMTDTPFIMLGFQPHRFQTTFLHETGHVLLGVLGKNPPREVLLLPFLIVLRPCPIDGLLSMKAFPLLWKPSQPTTVKITIKMHTIGITLSRSGIRIFLKAASFKISGIFGVIRRTGTATAWCGITIFLSRFPGE